MLYDERKTSLFIDYSLFLKKTHPIWEELYNQQHWSDNVLYGVHVEKNTTFVTYGY